MVEVAGGRGQLLIVFPATGGGWRQRLGGRSTRSSGCLTGCLNRRNNPELGVPELRNVRRTSIAITAGEQLTLLLVHIRKKNLYIYIGFFFFGGNVASGFPDLVA